jgi:hypothetical protein
MTFISLSTVNRYARLLRRIPRLPVFSARFLVLLVSLPAILPTAHAAGKDKSLTVSIYCMAYADGLKSVFVRSGKNQYQDITLSTANVVETRGVLVEDGRIVLHGPAGEDGKHPVVADAELGAIDQPLIVLHPAGADGGLAYHSKAVEMDSKKFPLGSFHLVNLSPHPVRILHDEEVIELQSEDVRIFIPDHSAGDSLSMRMDYKHDDNWLLLSSARWPSRNDRRTLVCFQLDPASKRMNVKSVPLRPNPSR